MAASAEPVRKHGRNHDPVQLSKLAALGELATGIAHELHQPLAIIAMVARNVEELVEERSVDQAVIRQKMEQVLRNVERARKITSNLRVFARLPSKEEVVAFDPLHAVRAAIDLYAPELRRTGVKLTVNLPQIEVEISGQPILFQQVFVNLLGNALDAIVQAGSARGKPHRITVDARRLPDSGHLCITLADTGGGVDDKLLDEIFQPFFTTKPAGKGTGMGLALSRRIIEDMGGTIVAANAEGGLAVSVYLRLS